jgi:hypothetical protein
MSSNSSNTPVHNIIYKNKTSQIPPHSHTSSNGKNDKSSSLGIKYPIPKSKNLIKMTHFSSFKTIGLGPSSSSKNIDNLDLQAGVVSGQNILGSKFRAVSHSPKGSSFSIQINNGSFKNPKPSLYTPTNSNSQKYLTTTSTITTLNNSPSHNSKKRLTQSPGRKSQGSNLINTMGKQTHSLTLESLPKLSDSLSFPSLDREGNPKQLSTYIYNIFFSKIIECQNQIKVNDPVAIVECLIKIFDSLSSTMDSKYRNISELLRVFCDPKLMMKNYKTENDSLNEANTKLRHEFECVKKEHQKMELLCKGYLEKISLSEQTIHIQEDKINEVRNKYKEMKNEYNVIYEENKTMKNYLDECLTEIDYLKEKERKLMKVIYHIHKKGVSVDEIIEGNIGNIGNLSNLSQSYLGSQGPMSQSQRTENDISQFGNQTFNSYFPEKVTAEHHLDQPKNVPKLDFTNIPGYESNNNSAIVDDGNEYLSNYNMNHNLNNSKSNQINKGFKKSNTLKKEDLKFNKQKLDFPIEEENSNLNECQNKILKKEKKSDYLDKNFNFNNINSTNSINNQNVNQSTKPHHTNSNSINSIPSSGGGQYNFKLNVNNMHSKNKIKDYNTEFLDKFEEYSESWRDEINKIKPFKESISEKLDEAKNAK